MNENIIKEKNSILDKVYIERKAKSVNAVKLAIEFLQENNIKVTLASIVKASLELSNQLNDKNLKISHMTILRNEVCKELYKNSCNFKRRKKNIGLRSMEPPLTSYELNRIKLLSNLTKSELLILLIESDRNMKKELSINANLREKLLTYIM